MKRKKNTFWGTVANLILRNRLLIIGGIILLTVFFGTQWKYMRFTFTEANLLPSNHPENIQYDTFIKTFGEEGNLIVIALKEEQFFEPIIFEKWIALNHKIESFSEVDFVLSINNVKELVKDESLKSFVLKSVFDANDYKLNDIKKFKQKLLLELPFYRNILYDNDGKTIRSAIYMDKNIVNTEKRKDFIFQTFIPLINAFEKDTGLDVKISGYALYQDFECAEYTR